MAQYHPCQSIFTCIARISGKVLGNKERMPTSKESTGVFVDFYPINMDDFEPSDINANATLEDFFVQAHRRGSRLIHASSDPKAAVVVADLRLVLYESMAQSKEIRTKGTGFSITNLVMDTQLRRNLITVQWRVASFHRRIITDTTVP
ncbi:hypothetical protein VTO42DRAFT_828 [Malbranchea cinnamomea]